MSANEFSRKLAECLCDIIPLLYHSRRYDLLSSLPMMTSSNGNIFRVTSPLWGNSPVIGEFPPQKPVTQSFDVFFDLRLNKLSKQSWGWWFETPLCPLLRHCNAKKCSSGIAMIVMCMLERNMCHPELAWEDDEVTFIFIHLIIKTPRDKQNGRLWFCRHF